MNCLGSVMDTYIQAIAVAISNFLENILDIALNISKVSRSIKVIWQYMVVFVPLKWNVLYACRPSKHCNIYAV